VVNSVSGGCSVPQQLAAGASCVLSVVFNAPHGAGDSPGTLVIESASGESRSVGLSGRSFVTNAGSSRDDGEEGGGAVGPWALLALALAVAALERCRRREMSNP
jgi:MYXO-CTERM domain-containing protein